MLNFVILDATETTIESQCLQNIANVTCCSSTIADGSDISNEQLANADIIGVWHTVWIQDDMLARLPATVKLLVRFGVGYDNVDIQSCAKRGIYVCNVPNYGTEEVADSAMSHILNLYRQTHNLAKAVSNGEKIKGPDSIAAAACNGGGARRVRGQTLGLIGLGRIGMATALRAKPFGFNIVFYDPHVSAGIDKAIGIERCNSLAELLERSDCVSLHCNCSTENIRMLNTDQFNQMKTNSFLINTARGELIDDNALAEALHSGKVGAASLDVHWNEPFLTMDHEDHSKHVLADCPNLTCTPHCAWYSKESRLEMRQIGASYVVSFSKQLKGNDGDGVNQKLKFSCCVNEHLMGKKE